MSTSWQPLLLPPFLHLMCTPTSTSTHPEHPTPLRDCLNERFAIIHMKSSFNSLISSFYAQPSSPLVRKPIRQPHHLKPTFPHLSHVHSIKIRALPYVVNQNGVLAAWFMVGSPKGMWMCFFCLICLILMFATDQQAVNGVGGKQFGICQVLGFSLSAQGRCY